MNETSKSIFSKIRDSRFATRYLIGNGIDIGSGPDSISQYMEFFPLSSSCRDWDLKDGDAQYMSGVPDSTFDFVYSSHCLEHMENPLVALNNWLRILKPGGHLLILVPDEDLYEQGVFPSTFNPDHKHTFTIYKEKSWSPASINLLHLFSQISYPTQVLKIELLDATYRFKTNQSVNKNRIDQSMSAIGECAIEIIARKL
jgi:SAM-dependent methyltransferase